MVRLQWTVRTNERSGTVIRLKSKGVKRATVLLRRSMLAEGSTLTIPGAKPRVRKHVLESSPKVMLQEARRTGLRSDPVVARYELRF